MAQEIINVGAAPNDGLGDPIRTAFIKCNDNFTELYGNISANLAGIANGTSNISISTANGNVTVGVAGTANVARFTAGGQLITGVVSATGNVRGGNIVTAGLISATGNVRGGNIVTAGLISATGNITGNYLIGNGSQLTGVTASSVNASALTGNTLSSNVLFSSLTSVGTLSNLSVSGNIAGGNIATAGLISATGNVTGSYILGNGSQLTEVNAVTVDVTNTNGLTTIYYPTFVENRTTGQIARADVDFTYRTDDNLLTVGNVSVPGNIQGGNLLTGGVISATGNITGGNIRTAGQVTATGNINAGGMYIDGNAIITGNANVQGNLTYNNIFNLTTSNLVLGLGNNQTGVNVTGGGIVVGNTNEASLLYNFASSSWVSNINFSVAGNVTTAGFVSATGNITGGNLATGGQVSATGNISGGNLLTSGAMSATGNITGDNIVTAGFVTATGNITGGNVQTAGIMSSTGTATAGNLSTGGVVTATGNIQGGNLLTGGLISATSTITSAANITGGNLITAGLISATGNITGDYIIGNGSQLTGLPAGYSNADVATYLASNANIVISTTGNITTTGNVAGNYFIGNGSLLTGIFASEDYLQAGRTGDVTLVGLNSDLVFNSVTAQSGTSQISLNTTTGVVSLQGGVTYCLTASPSWIGFSDPTGGFLVYTWVDATTNTPLVSGISAAAIPVTLTTNAQTNQLAVTVIYTPPTNQTVKVRVTAANGTATFRQNFSFLSVTQIGVTAGTTSFTNLSVTGNITGGNLLTGGVVSATGNVRGGNIVTAGLISATGNITGNYLIGNGSQLTGLTSTSVPNWTAAGTIQSVGLTATVTPPTLATSPARNQVYYRQIGPKTWEVSAVYYQTSAAGANIGLGDYLFTLPGGLQFDTSIQFQQIFNTVPAGSGPGLYAFAIPGSTFASSVLTTISTAAIVPYSATQYRIIGTIPATDTNFVSSGWAQPQNPGMSWVWSFTFQST